MNAQQLLYRPEEAAEALSLSRATVYELIASGDLASVKIGRSRRITRDALEHYVARLESNGAA
jgi:excisionase family DNA binding protein